MTKFFVRDRILHYFSTHTYCVFNCCGLTENSSNPSNRIRFTRKKSIPIQKLFSFHFSNILFLYFTKNPIKHEILNQINMYPSHIGNFMQNCADFSNLILSGIKQLEEFIVQMLQFMMLADPNLKD